MKLLTVLYILLLSLSSFGQITEPKRDVKDEVKLSEQYNDIQPSDVIPDYPIDEIREERNREDFLRGQELKRLHELKKSPLK